VAPSQRYWQENKQGQRQYKKLTDWGRQVLIQAARWLPNRRTIGVGDASVASIDLLNDVRPWVTMITRLRLDTALHKPPPRRVPGTGRILIGDYNFLTETPVAWTSRYLNCCCHRARRALCLVPPARIPSVQMA
jgi:hypothetical protein